MERCTSGPCNWVDFAVDCDDSTLASLYTFYRSCSVNGTVYNAEDFAVYKKDSNEYVCRILAMFEPRRKQNERVKCMGTVRRYIFAKDLTEECNPENFPLDKQNEVIEDLRYSDRIILLKHLVRKCEVTFATVEDPVYLIKSLHLNVRENFSCRYKITNQCIVPIISSEDPGEITILDNFNNVDSTPKNKTCLVTFRSTTGKSKQKRKSNDSCEISPSKSVRLALRNNKSSADKVRRNLNKSFKIETELPNDRIVEQILNDDILKRLYTKQDSVDLKICDSSNNVWINTSDELGVTYLETEKVKKLQTPYQSNEEIIIVVADNDDEEETKRLPEREQNSHCKWLNPEVDCEDSTLGYLYKFYRSCSVNDTVYNVEDFVVYKKDSNEYVCRILAMNQPRKKRNGSANFLGTVRRYIFARDLQKEYNPDNFPLDKENEVIEDVRSSDVIISLENLIRKSEVIYVTTDDPVHLIKSHHLKGNGSYFCRYEIRNTGIVPVTSVENKGNFMIANESKHLELMSENKVGAITPGSAKNKSKQKRTSNESLETCEHSPNKSVRSEFQNEKENLSVCKVKRNLNESFKIESESPNAAPILNYSIIEQVPNNDDTLKLKLRLSKMQNCIVNLERCDFSSRNISNGVSTNFVNELSVTPVKNSQTSCKSKEKTAIVKDDNDKMETRRTLRSKKKDAFCGTSPAVTPTIRKSTRIVKRVSYMDYISPVKSTSKRNRNNSAEEYDSLKIYPESLNKTPKKQHSGSFQNNTEQCALTPKSKIKNVRNTPSAKARLVREGVITPSVQRRMTPLKKCKTPLDKARVQLHVSYIPEALPCREKEFDDILNFLETKLSENDGGCMYISGVPGTGKTATVTEVIKKLQGMVENGSVPDFDYINVNGMRLSDPRQAYVEILRQLGHKTVHWESARNILETRFTKRQKKARPIILVIDELDVLCTKKQEVVYTLLDWPSKACAHLIVITIANTMDLPERLLMGKVTSRIGITRLPFEAYTYKQLQEIVMKRLCRTDAFHSDAVQLVARKVASQTGDARRALDICRRATEIAERSGNELVSIEHVNEAIKVMMSRPIIRAIKGCSKIQQLVLQAIVAEVERTGNEETTLADTYTTLMSICAIEGTQMISFTLALATVSKLTASHLLLTDQKSKDINQKLKLRVNPDDVFYGLKKD